MSKKRIILLVDNDNEILTLMSEVLRMAGYSVINCSDSTEAIDVAYKIVPHLIIMELVMLQMDGIELCSELRKLKELEETFIVFYTERNEDYAQIAALNAGADDYIIKPSKSRVMVKRIDALIKRSRVLDKQAVDIKPKGLTINKDEYIVYRDGEKLLFPRKQFELIYYLAKQNQKLVTRDELYFNVWGQAIEKDKRTLDVHIRRIRKILGEGYIITIRGVGYVLNMEATVA